MLLNYLKKIFLYFTREKFTDVYHISARWHVTYNNDNSLPVTKYCDFTISKSNKNRYKLTYSGHNAKHHSLYNELFKKCRLLTEGIYYVSGGELLKHDQYLTLDEWKDRLNKAINDENYVLAEKLRTIIENKLNHES